MVEDRLEETGVSFDDGEDVEKCLSTSVFFLYYSAESLRLFEAANREARTYVCLSTGAANGQ